jgi:osmotically-inducible protein OsmY
MLVAAPLSAAETNGGIADLDVTRAIETELALDEGVAAHLIDVTTSEGIVTLEGSVDNILAKSRAEEIARSTKGVRSVVNRIAVSTPDRPDEELADGVRNALLIDPAADSYQIDVEANDGLVTLKGTVESWAEKQLAAHVAKGVRGVTKIKNQIDIQPTVERTDAEIKDDVQRRLDMDVRVDAGLIDANVNDGRVRLSGTVGSAQEKWQAYSDAWVSGTTTVTVDDLKVEWWARDQMKRIYRTETPSDDEIRQAVKDAFLYDPRVLSFKPTVTVDGGVVTLRGEVDSLSAKRAAAGVAENTVGVWRVRNHLRVRPEGRPDDQELAERVRQAIGNDPYVERHEITVTVVNGKVYLYGDVDTDFEKEHAGDVAAGTKGVVDVRNSLAVRQAYAWKSDAELRDDIEEELFWNPHVDTDRVTVTVDDGAAILTGTVDSWYERYKAADEAREAGAKSVQNQLRVENMRYVPPPGGRRVPTPGTVD